MASVRRRSVSLGGDRPSLHVHLLRQWRTSCFHRRETQPPERAIAADRGCVGRCFAAEVVAYRGDQRRNISTEKMSCPAPLRAQRGSKRLHPTLVPVARIRGWRCRRPTPVVTKTRPYRAAGNRPCLRATSISFSPHPMILRSAAVLEKSRRFEALGLGNSSLCESTSRAAWMSGSRWGLMVPSYQASRLASFGGRLECNP